MGVVAASVAGGASTFVVAGFLAVVAVVGVVVDAAGTAVEGAEAVVDVPLVVLSLCVLDEQAPPSSRTSARTPTPRCGPDIS